jgi:tRNA pseudouridine38-40 synthase
MRIAAVVEYCGFAYAGWQRQEARPTVQAMVERALSSVADHPVTVHCAGRTDAGVHALHQVIHFDTEAERPSRGWVLGGNVHLPGDISLLWAGRPEGDFHARYSATGRSYRYVILNRNARPGLLHGRVAWECRPLNEQRMAEAGAYLVGRHDFSAFRARDCQAKSPVREVRRLEVQRRGDMIILEIEADGFLQHMVRNIAGVLMAAGMGKARPEWAGEVLASRDRAAGGVTAPADGLYLSGISYPGHFGIPAPQPPVL